MEGMGIYGRVGRANVGPSKEKKKKKERMEGTLANNNKICFPSLFLFTIRETFL